MTRFRRFLTMCLLLAAGLLSGPARAQAPALAEARTDLARAATPHARAEALLHLSWTLLDTGAPPDSSRHYLTRGWRLARQLGDSLLLADAYQQFGEYYLRAGDLPATAAWLRRAAAARAYLVPGKWVRVLDNLAQLHLAAGQPDSALVYQRRALRAVPAVPEAEPRAYLRAQVAMGLSTTFYRLQELDSTAFWAHRARRLFLGIGNDQDAANALNQEALVFLKQGQLATATRLLRQVLAQRLAEGNELELPVVLVALGNAAARQDSTAQALAYLRWAVRLARQQQKAGVLPAIYSNLGKAFEGVPRPDSAEYYHQLAIAEQLRLAGPNAAVTMRLTAGRFYQAQGRWPAAEQQARAVLAPAARPTLNDQMEAYALLRAAAEHRHDLAAAYRLLQHETALRDSLRRRDSRRLTEALRVRYETAHAEQQVQLLTQRQLLARLRYQRRLGGLAGLGGLALLLGGAAGPLRAGAGRRRPPPALARHAAHRHGPAQHAAARYRPGRAARGHGWARRLRGAAGSAVGGVTDGDLATVGPWRGGSAARGGRSPAACGRCS